MRCPISTDNSRQSINVKLAEKDATQTVISAPLLAGRLDVQQHVADLWIELWILRQIVEDEMTNSSQPISMEERERGLLFKKGLIHG